MICENCSMSDARKHFLNEYYQTRERVQDALYFDDFDEAEELLNRFERWSGSLLSQISAADSESIMFAADIIAVMDCDLRDLLPRKAA